MKLLGRTDLKIDVLTAIATAAIGLEFLPGVFGVDLGGFSVAWFVMPPVLLFSVMKFGKLYVSPPLVLRLSLLFFVLGCYALLVDWNEQIPFLNVPEVVRSYALSLVIYSFFYVHGKKPASLQSFFIILTFVGVVAAMLNIASILGYVEKGSEITRIGGTKYIIRQSPLGDPNITTIYTLCLAVAMPQWQYFLGWYRGMLLGLLGIGLVVVGMLGAASRGGFLSLAIALASFFFVTWREKKGKTTGALIFLVIPIAFALLMLPGPSFSGLLDTTLFRFTSIAEKGMDEYAFGARIAGVRWFLDDLLSGPRFFGFGFEAFYREANAYGAEWLPHNTFIDMYVIGGGIGFATFAALWIQCILAFLRSLRSGDSSNRTYGKLGLAFGLGVCMLINSVSIPFTKIIWAYLGIGSGLYLSQKAGKELRQGTPK